MVIEAPSKLLAGEKAARLGFGDPWAHPVTLEEAKQAQWVALRFPTLEGEATREGLWLTSTVIPPGGTVNDRFRLVAVEVGRGTPCAPSAVGGATDRSAIE